VSSRRRGKAALRRAARRGASPGASRGRRPAVSSSACRSPRRRSAL